MSNSKYIVPLYSDWPGFLGSDTTSRRRSGVGEFSNTSTSAGGKGQGINGSSVTRVRYNRDNLLEEGCAEFAITHAYKRTHAVQFPQPAQSTMH